MMAAAKGRGFAPEYVLFDGWHASLENLKQVRDNSWPWIIRLKGNREVSPAARSARSLDGLALGEAGQVVYSRGCGLIRVFRTDDPNGVVEC